MTKKTVSFRGMTVEYYNNYPDRPVIVFLHDSLGSIELWRDFPSKLAETTRCNILLYDRLGYGRSERMLTHVRPTNYLELEADTLNDLLNHFKIDDAILFGHSDGGSIALITASKYKKNITAVIVEAAHIFVEEITLNGIYEAINAYRTTNLPERLAKYHGDKVDSIFRAWTETWTRAEYRNWNIEDFLPALTAPLLFIQGECDEYGSLDQVYGTLQKIGGTGKSTVIPSVGHTPHKEDPDTTLKVSRHFILGL